MTDLGQASAFDPLQTLDNVNKPSILTFVKFTFDSEYVSGAIVLTALAALFVAVVLWIAPGEFSFWRHPHFDGHPLMHLRFALGIAALLAGGATWVFQARRRKDK